MRVAVAASLLLLAVLAPAAQAAQEPARIIVGRDPGLSAAERAEIRDDANVDLVRTLRVANTEVVEADHPQAALAALRKDPDVRYAELDRVRRAFASDPDFHFQWALDNTGTNLSAYYKVASGTPDADMDVPDAWPQSTGSGVTVAVVDTGIDSTHPDFAGKISSLSRNFLTDRASTDYHDGEGHGTHVSGIIAAARDNGVGVAGIAPDANVMSLRVLDDNGSGYDSDIADAFDYAGDHGIRVVNASLGGTDGTGKVLKDAIDRHPGTLFVVAAGNGGPDEIGDDNDVTPTWPCSLPSPNVICVGASTDTDGRASFSNYGANSVDLFAPGQYIWSTVRGGGTHYDSGTSMASPAVAAEAALALAADPGLSTAALKDAVLGTTDATSAFAGRSLTGGRANAAGAVARVAPATPPDDDGDGLPNAADSTPRGPDSDGDGLPQLDDSCPAQAATTANGCPAVATVQRTATPTPPAPVPADSDGDGKTDSLDACPTERAATANGCPLASVRSVKLSVVKRTHRVKVTVRTHRAARVAIKVERKACKGKGKKQRCKWKAVASGAKVTRRDAAAFTTNRLARGPYRVAVTLSSSAGRAKVVRKAFRV